MNRSRIEPVDEFLVRTPSPRANVGRSDGVAVAAGDFAKSTLPRACIALAQLPTGDAEYWERITDRATD